MRYGLICYIYMGRFAPELAQKKWILFKKHMKKKAFGMVGFREYLDSYKGRWTPRFRTNN